MNQKSSLDPTILSRAQGCLLGQLAGDALGSLVEFRTPESIRRDYPLGVRDLADGGTFNTIAGQPTDDSEMALLLARMLIKQGRYDAEEARKAYVYWLESGPFDRGNTVSAGLLGHPNHDSQSNGAMMRVSPLGIFCARRSPGQGAEEVRDEPAKTSASAEWAGHAAELARRDAELTHPNPVCVQANALYVMAIAHAVRTGPTPEALYRQITAWAREMGAEETLMDAVTGAEAAPPEDYVRHQGWVLIAFRNALWQLLHAPSLEEGVVDTVMRGGDTDTTAAICGALLGAVHGREAVPSRWVEILFACRPEQGRPEVHQPRPPCFWPTDALELAAALAGD